MKTYLSIALVVVSIGLIVTYGNSCGQVRFGYPESTTNPTAPSDPSIPVTPSSIRNVHFSQTVAAANTKLDILLVLDDSNSMLPDNQKLAAKMSAFVGNLSNSSIDWQMCVTTTSTRSVNGTAYWGASVQWSNYTPATGIPSWVLKAGTSNLSTIFNNTINDIGAGWAGTDDERGIKAAKWHAYNGDLNYSSNSGCYRSDAALAVIIISDEDERSVGGNESQVVYAGELKELENDDLPTTYVNYIKEIFGANKRFTVNSIIVKPNDSACKTEQDASGAKSHYGLKYAELTNLTGGGLGSICATDYNTNLTLFTNKITSSLSSITLECAPVNGVKVSILPAMGAVKTSTDGNRLIFDPVVPEGHKITLDYQCYETP